MPSERQPNWFKALAWLILIALAWFFWRPAGAVIAILALGNLRKIVITNSLAWEAPRYAAAFGYFTGGAIALLIQLIIYFAVVSLWARLGFTAFGLMPILYVGYGVPGNPSQRNLADSYRLIAEGSAVVSYLVVSIVILGLGLVLFRWS